MQVCTHQLLHVLTLALTLQVRLMLVLAPATCCLSGVAADQILKTFCRSIHPEEGSGGWTGLFKAFLDGQEAAPTEATQPQKPASSTVSSSGAGKKQKGQSKVRTPHCLVVRCWASQTFFAMADPEACFVHCLLHWGVKTEQGQSKVSTPYCLLQDAELLIHYVLWQTRKPAS